MTHFGSEENDIQRLRTRVRTVAHLVTVEHTASHHIRLTNLPSSATLMLADRQTRSVSLTPTYRDWLTTRLTSSYWSQSYKRVISKRNGDRHTSSCRNGSACCESSLEMAFSLWLKQGVIGVPKAKNSPSDRSVNGRMDCIRSRSVLVGTHKTVNPEGMCQFSR